MNEQNDNKWLNLTQIIMHTEEPRLKVESMKKERNHRHCQKENISSHMGPIKNIIYKFGMSLRQPQLMKHIKKHQKTDSPGGNRQNEVSRNCRRTRGGGLALLRRRENHLGRRKSQISKKASHGGWVIAQVNGGNVPLDQQFGKREDIQNLRWTIQQGGYHHIEGWKCLVRPHNKLG